MHGQQGATMELSRDQVSLVAQGFRNKGFDQETAVFLAEVIAAGVGTSALRDSVGFWGMEQVERAVNDVMETPKKDLTYNR
jgi:hypothetical protein